MNKQDKRTLLVGAVAAGLISVLGFGISPWLDNWRHVKTRLAQEQKKLELIDTSRSPAAAARHAAVLKAVPTFEIPQAEDKQRLLFASKCDAQIEKAGINVKSLNFLSRKKLQKGTDVKLLQLQCRGKGKYDQLLQWLASANENPYLVGIEELQITCNEKKRQELELILTLSTFAE